jgi:phosphate transport system substrate-binding protein
MQLLMFLVSSAYAETLHITGCGISKKAYIEKALAVYSRQNSLIPRLSGGGATKGIRLASEDRIDIGASCRQRLADIGGNIHEKEKDIKMIHIAWDALVIIVNKENKLNNITQENIVDIFQGRIKNWNELDGPNLPIKVLIRKGKTSGVGYMARLLIFGNPDYEYLETVYKYTSTEPLEKNTMKYKGAIAFDGISSAKKMDLKILDIEGVEPTKANIISGAYTLFRPLFVAVNKHNKNPKVTGFIDFLLGPEGQKIVSSEGTINLEEGIKLKELWNKRTELMGNSWQENL